MTNFQAEKSKSMLLSRELEQQMKDGHLRPGDRIESVRTLAREFSVGQQVVRSAFDMLERKKLIVRRQGAGTFVTDGAVSVAPRKRVGFYIHKDDMNNTSYRGLFLSCIRIGPEAGWDVFYVWELDARTEADLLLVTGNVTPELIRELEKRPFPSLVLGNYENLPENTNICDFDVGKEFSDLAELVLKDMKPASLGILLGGAELPSCQAIARSVKHAICKTNLPFRETDILFSEDFGGYKTLNEVWAARDLFPETVLVAQDSLFAFARYFYSSHPGKLPRLAVWIDEGTMIPLPGMELGSAFYRTESSMLPLAAAWNSFRAEGKTVPFRFTVSASIVRVSDGKKQNFSD